MSHVILCHFNSYSVLLQLARFGPSIVFPELTAAAEDDPEALRRAVAERLALQPGELTHEPEFEEWLGTPPDAARVHLFRVRMVEPPSAPLETHGGKWRQLSELRGIAPQELKFARRVFDLIMGT
jgi:hypothetical protein